MERQRLNAKADRVFRAQGNRSGRGRMRADTRLHQSRPPRGLIVSTGEEIPAGQSLRARLVIVEVQRGDVILEHLTLAQHAASTGAYAKAVAGFVQWLAPQIVAVRAELAALAHERRTRIPAGVHARTADAIAQLSAAWTMWLRYVVHVGAATEREATAIEGEVWETLTWLASEQADAQRASDPVERFRTLLFAALTAGDAHVASLGSPSLPPPDGESWGWRRDETGSLKPRGRCIGWHDEQGLYLEPDAAYGAALRMGDGVNVGVETLIKRLHERGFIRSIEMRGVKQHLRVRRTVASKRRYVVHVAHEMTHSRNGCPSCPSCPEDEENQEIQHVA